jgi:hypothetical protein
MCHTLLGSDTHRQALHTGRPDTRSWGLTIQRYTPCFLLIHVYSVQAMLRATGGVSACLRTSYPPPGPAGATSDKTDISQSG